MKYNDVPMSAEDIKVMIEFLQVFWNFHIETKSAKELLFSLRQTLFMHAISVPVPHGQDMKSGFKLQVESLEATLKDVTFDDTKLKLHKQP